MPRAIELIPIDAKSGKRAIFGQPGVILEAFKPGDEPPDSTKIIGDGSSVAAAGATARMAASCWCRPRRMPPAACAAPASPRRPASASGGLTGQGGGLY